MDLFDAGRNNISQDYRQRTTEIIQLTQDYLHTYDRGILTAEDQLSYDIYEYFREWQMFALSV